MTGMGREESSAALSANGGSSAIAAGEQLAFWVHQECPL